MAETGVDYLAVGSLTHSAPVLDIGLDLRVQYPNRGIRLMLLTIDIGNTNTVLGIFEADKLMHSWRIKTDARNTADELMLTFRGLLADVPVTGVAGCSTVPAALRELRTMLTRYWSDVPTVLVEPGIRTGVALLFDNPKEVGSDRIVNTLAAYSPGQRARHRGRLRHLHQLRRGQWQG